MPDGEMGNIVVKLPLRARHACRPFVGNDQRFIDSYLDEVPRLLR